MFDFFKNLVNSNKYKNHPEAIIISCFFNPQKSPYRTKAFNEFYSSIKHMNHRIIECVIGDAEPELPENKNIVRVHTPNLLWHKESLLNKLVSELPEKYKYIFWIDADVIFTNKNWLVESVDMFKYGIGSKQVPVSILQPFEYCVHLNKDEKEPSFDYELYKTSVSNPRLRHPQMWRSFCANHISGFSNNENYDIHGHVGFAWAAKREVLERVPLYDRALIGGADHIIAHAAAGQIEHSCIAKSFTDNLADVYDWSHKFYNVVKGEIGYVKGDLFHIWHGDIEKRQYLKRIQDFTPKTKEIVEKDANGLYVTPNKKDDEYMKQYFDQREVKSTDDNFTKSMVLGYVLNDGVIGGIIGGNLMGGMMGDMLNSSEDDHSNCNHSHHSHETVETNHDTNNVNDTTDYSQSNNFS